MIERSHLTIIRALADHGSVTAAANALCLSQSALSHQIRYLEQKLELSLWERDGRQVRLTQAGYLLLDVARQLLPVFDQTEQTLKAYQLGRKGVLRIGVECHPCYEWLKIVLKQFLELLPDIDVDIVSKFQFSGIEGLANHHIDVLVTPDITPHQDIVYEPMYDYEQVLLVSNANGLSKQQKVEPEELLGELILTFPVPKERLDVFSQFLLPAGVHPETKTMSSLDIMVQMVSMNRGVTVIPDWLAAEYAKSMNVKAIKLGKKGILKTLSAGIRANDAGIPYLKRFIELGREQDVIR